jgi:8-oxo-dGTP pyrophosphatase MutT (NUDIX family)
MVDRVDCVLESVPWPFARDQAAAIDAHWAAAVARKPMLFDGRVLLQTRGQAETAADGARVFRGAYTEVAFREFLAWRDFGHPVLGFRNGFGMAALRGSDGAFVLGEMGPQTANAGRVYFPSGTPDRSDLSDGAVDIEGSVRRELAEETGLSLADLAFAPGFVVLHDAVRVCFMKRVDAREPAAVLADRIRATLATEDNPELCGIHIVRGPSDLTPAMPVFVAAYLRRAFGPSQSG